MERSRVTQVLRPGRGWRGPVHPPHRGMPLSANHWGRAGASLSPPSCVFDSHACPHTDPSNCQQAGEAPALPSLGALPRSSAQPAMCVFVCVCVCPCLFVSFLTAANTPTTHAKPLQTQPAWLLCDREANLLRQNTLTSRHATLAAFQRAVFLYHNAPPCMPQ